MAVIRQNKQESLIFIVVPPKTNKILGVSKKSLDKVQKKKYKKSGMTDDNYEISY